MENTSNYGLKRWDPEDRILHTEFNDNWEKIDAALKSNADGVAALQTALAGAANCGIAVTSYTGAGVYGAENANTLSFEHPPLAVFIFGGDVGFLSRDRGMRVLRGNSTASTTTTWSADGKSVSWYAGHSAYQMNEKEYNYTVVYLYQT